MYQIEVYDSSGALVADLSGRETKKQLSFKRNSANVLAVSFSIDNIKKLAKDLGITVWNIFAVNVNELRIKRDGTVIGAGEIVYAVPTTSNDNLEIKAVGWFDLLKDRYTGATKDFVATDAGQIAWTLIDESQSLANGDFGITEGVIDASVNRDRSYSYKNIRDAIIQLSEVINGFDFEITWDKKFNIYYPKIGMKRDDIVFSYPGNIKSLSFVRDGTQIVNKVIAVGAGTGIDAIRTTSEDSTSEGLYHLRENFLQLSDISVQDTLQEHADEEVRAMKNFYDMVDIILDGNLVPTFGNYSIGDEVKIVTDDKEVFGTINDYFRIDAIDLTVDSENNEDVRLRLMRI